MCRSLNEKRGVSLISLVITIVVLLIISGITITLTLDSGFLNITSGTKEDLAITNIKDYGSVIKSSISVDKNLTKNNLVDMFADEVINDNIDKSDKEKFKVIDKDYDNLLVTLSKDGAVAVIDLSDFKFTESESNVLNTDAKHTVIFKYRESGDEAVKKFIVNTGITLANFFITEDDSFLVDKTWSPELDLNEPVTKNLTYTEHTYRLKTVIASFDLTGGVLNGNTTVEDVDYKEGDIVENIGTPTKEHYIFESWQPPLNEIIEEDTLFVAQWIPRVYTYTFKLNGGNISGSTNDVIISGAYGTKANKPVDPTRNDYDFVNWSPSVPVNFEGNNTYTAQWVIKTYTYTFKMNGGTSGGTTADKIYSGPAGSPSQQPVAPTLSNYNFDRWSQNVPSVYIKDMTFIAQWTPVTYTYTFRLNGGNIGGSTANRTTSGAYNTNTTTPPNPTYVGYDFMGWGRTVPGKYTSNETFTAQWSIQTFTYTFRLNGGNIGGSTANRTYSGAYNTNTTTPPTPTYSGYNFNGWGKTVPGKYTSNETFTAQWTVATYTFTFNLNGGNVNGNTSNVQVVGNRNSSFSSSLIPKPVKTTYKHVSTPLDTLIEWTPAIPSTFDGNRTFTAVWSEPMVIQMKKASSNASVLIPIKLIGGNSAMISNNGGPFVKYTSSDPLITNSVSAGTAFTVKIAGRIDQFSYWGKSVTYLNQMYKIIDWGELQADIIRFSRAHSEPGCVNLVGPIPETRSTTFTYASDASYLFYKCTSLSGQIPQYIFGNTDRRTKKFEYAFSGCINLNSTIPDHFFHEANIAESFKGIFEGCTKLYGSIPERLFQVNKWAEDFESVFYNCKGLTGELDRFMFSSTGVPSAKTFRNTFRNTGITGTIPWDLFAGMSNVTTYRSVFEDCSGLTGTLSNRLFQDSTKVTSFHRAFRGCTGIERVYSDMFDKNTRVTDFAYTFYNCRNMVGTAPALWERTNVTSHTECFYKCEKLGNWNTIKTKAGWF